MRLDTLSLLSVLYILSGSIRNSDAFTVQTRRHFSSITLKSSSRHHQTDDTFSTLFNGSKNIAKQVDVIVVGSGLAGLSCASLLSYSKLSTLVLESHDTVGGCAHSWTRRGFTFESGPSLYSGLSIDPSPNPLKNIFQVIEEEPEFITYDRWGTVLPDGTKFAAKIGPEEFNSVILEQYSQNGTQAKEEFATLMHRMTPLSEAAQSLPSMALREDVGVVLTTLFRYPKAVWKTIQVGSQLQAPFQTVLDEIQIQNDFVRNWLDMLCFLLQGLPSKGTTCAVMAYMLADWYRPGNCLDYPKGGSGAIVDALVRGVQKWGHIHKTQSAVHVNTHVKEILIEGSGKDARAAGVRLEDGTTILAKQAVVCNIDPFVISQLLSQAQNRNLLSSDVVEFFNTRTDESGEKAGSIPNLNSFIHLHAGIDASGLPPKPSADFPAQWAVIKSWDVEGGVEAPRNIVLCSMPSLLDPSLAPEGKHVLHAYVPATEPYSEWAHLERGSEEYLKKKDEAAEFLWDAIEKYIPNARNRVVPGTLQIGTPLTHERFLRRTRGSYGPRAEAGKHTLPGHTTPLKGLYMCGDYTFPGIGVPATSASGAITANTIVSISQHFNILEKIRIPPL